MNNTRHAIKDYFNRAGRRTEIIRVVVQLALQKKDKQMKLEHIGIAVKNLEESNDLFARIFGREHYKIEEVLSEKVRTSFFKTGDTKVELLEATDESSAIAHFLKKRGEGLHHLAFEVDDIRMEMNRLREEGFTLLNEEPKKGADNKWICFLHPKGTNRVLIELCQEIQ